jgi:methyl-accepting chemotaxis protein
MEYHADLLRDRGAALRDVYLAIKSIIPSSEKDFLAIGSHLSDFAGKAGEICQAALDASHLLGADQIDTMAVKLRQIQDVAASGTTSARGRLEEDMGTLKEMIAMIHQISLDLEGFAKLLKTLRVLGISTRIESSRFADEQFRFESLAGDVERSALVIEGRYKEMCRQVGTLSTGMNEALQEALRTDSAQTKNVGLILDKLHQAMDRLEEKHASAAAAVESLSNRSNDVVRSISEIIMSLQFHDICRQQIEHVGEAIEDLSISMEERRTDHGPNQSHGDHLPVSIPSAHRICNLQLSQLSYTKGTFLEAVEKITDGMERIADSIDSMNRDTKSMLSADDDKKESYLLQIEQGARDVLVLLDDNRRVGNRLGEAIRAVTETCSYTSGAVLAIQDIVDDIKLLSLNARIKAAKAGREGWSVGVLSDAIERLSGEMTKISNGLSDSFLTLSKGASELECRLEPAGRSSGEGGDRLLSELEDIKMDSTEANGKAMGLMSSISDASRRLADSIRSVTGHEITVHRTVAASLEEVSSSIKGIADDLRPFVGTDGSIEEENLGHLQDRYTMESERQVHRAQFADTLVPTSAYEDTFGDNVELF